MLLHPLYPRPQVSLASLFQASPQTGFCHHCERVSRWDDHVDTFSCQHCGEDPLRDAETPFELNLGALAPSPAQQAAPPLWKPPAGAAFRAALSMWSRPQRLVLATP